MKFGFGGGSGRSWPSAAGERKKIRAVARTIRHLEKRAPVYTRDFVSPECFRGRPNSGYTWGRLERAKDARRLRRGHPALLDSPRNHRRRGDAPEGWTRRPGVRDGPRRGRDLRPHARVEAG